VGPIKAMLLELDSGKAAGFLCPLIGKSTGATPIREQLEKFAAAESLQI
jgi:signal transduction protein with GAF and PtsI domain